MFQAGGSISNFCLESQRFYLPIGREEKLMIVGYSLHTETASPNISNGLPLELRRMPLKLPQPCIMTLPAFGVRRGYWKLQYEVERESVIVTAEQIETCSNGTVKKTYLRGTYSVNVRLRCRNFRKTAHCSDTVTPRLGRAPKGNV